MQRAFSLAGLCLKIRLSSKLTGDRMRNVKPPVSVQRGANALCDLMKFAQRPCPPFACLLGSLVSQRVCGSSLMVAREIKMAPLKCGSKVGSAA